METILVPTDFSETAVNASEYAVNLAKAVKAKVVLFHTYHLPMPVSDFPVMAISPDELQKENEYLLKKEADRLSNKTGVEVKYLAKMGLAADEILKEQKNTNLIVMGMKGAGKLSEALMGSITTATLRKAKVPVLVIPEKAIYKKPERIVFASDYDPRTDTRTPETLKFFENAFGVKVYVVNIKQKKEIVSVSGREKGLALEQKESVYYFPESDDLVEGINEFVKNHEVDMVAIIPHRYNLLERLFHKSVSKKMAFHTHVPLLALPDDHKTVSARFFLSLTRF